VENSVARDNRGDGVRAMDADELVIAGNQIVGHDEGIVVTGRSPGAQITGNTVRGAVSTAIAVRGGPSGLVKANRVDGGEIGLQVRDARIDLRDNVVSGATGHGLSVVGATDGTTVAGNSLAGAGSSAVDVARVTPPAVVTVGPNNADGWHVQVSPAEYVSDLIRDHPLLPLWAFVLLAPLALVLVRRRRGTRPYVEGEGVVEPPATVSEVHGETRLIPFSRARQSAPPPAPPVHRPAPTPGSWPDPRPAPPVPPATPNARFHRATRHEGVVVR
jgi:hypothetical protein